MDADIEEIDERSDEEDQRYRQRGRKQCPRPHALHVSAPPTTNPIPGPIARTRETDDHSSSASRHASSSLILAPSASSRLSSSAWSFSRSSTFTRSWARASLGWREVSFALYVESAKPASSAAF